MKKIIYLNAGHYDDPNTPYIDDPGAIANKEKEAVITMKIRDLLYPMLSACGLSVKLVPDNLNLVPSIGWVNQHAKKIDDGLAFSIHANAGGGKGAEILYYGGNAKSRKIAEQVINPYCEVTGLNNRGAKPDTYTRHKRLGWVRDTNCWAIVIEVGFLDSTDILKILDYDLIARGITAGIKNVFGITIIDDTKSQIKGELDKIEESTKNIQNIIEKGGIL